MYNLQKLSVMLRILHVEIYLNEGSLDAKTKYYPFCPLLSPPTLSECQASLVVLESSERDVCAGRAEGSSFILPVIIMV